MKVWITKCAMSSGIRLVEGHVSDKDTNVFVVTGDAGIYYRGHDWHRTKAKAILRMRTMICAKLKSIDQQRNKLKAKLAELDGEST